MPRPRDPNNPFKTLAYQHAIAEAIEAFILEKYVGNDAASPALTLECPQLPREDSVVPEDAFILFLEQVKSHRYSVEKELTRYDFVRRNDAQGITFSPSVNAILHPSKALTEQTQPGTAAPTGQQTEVRRRKSRGGKH